MQYRRFGKTNVMLSALGFGTNRFAVSSPDNEREIEEAACLVREAVLQGVNYIDVANTYSRGCAETIVKKALKGIDDSHAHITVKVRNYGGTITADETYRRICDSLAKMGKERASFFVAWGIRSYKEFQSFIKKGKLYDGALRAQVNGLIDHICCSLHVSPSDIIKIMESGMFEGVTISYSALNYQMMRKVLEKAEELDIGVITMNSLGGGVIPQNPEFFQFLKMANDESAAAGALRFSYSHPQITCLLSGMASQVEVRGNVSAFSAGESQINRRKRLDAVDASFKELSNFCTGCNYCGGCPSGIDTAMLMQAYNQIYFTNDKPRFNRAGRRLLENINIAVMLLQQSFMPDSAVNPCKQCGLCEEKCTQSIPVIERLKELYGRFDESAFSKEHIKARLGELIVNAGYKRIAFYAAGGYTAQVLQYLKQFYPDYRPEIFLFDTNPKLWGSYNSGIEIQDPAKLPEIKPNIVVISQYTWQDEIYDALRHLESEISIVKLHKNYDALWLPGGGDNHSKTT